MSQAGSKRHNTEQRLKVFMYCIGEELYSLRISQKKSIKAVAKDTKMSSRIISQIERGIYENFYVSRLLRLCKYYKVDMVEMLGRAEAMDQNNTI
ncbi:helix-turn-helix domain-containing protein [Chitinophaga sp. LS1]|uniref:helix-turn-helix domain-containing protein n=1 Tax=Chitinophaga sp. LS1 TaxID=3051176 RepID=UPI0039EF2EEC